MNKISSLARMGIAHHCFGNPIPQAAYDLIEATEKCVQDFNPPNRIADAAPALLEALQTLVFVIDNGTQMDVTIATDEAKVIISKALGETK